jgi:hypothetical protein
MDIQRTITIKLPDDADLRATLQPSQLSATCRMP